MTANLPFGVISVLKPENEIKEHEQTLELAIELNCPRIFGPWFYLIKILCPYSGA
jgi:hypothetical protein